MRRVVRFESLFRTAPAAGVGVLLAAILLGNRGVSQISIGPVYLLDATILLAFLVRPIAVVRSVLTLLPVSIVLVLAGAWVAVEWGSGQLDPLAVRRSAMAVYAVVPAVLWVYREQALAWIRALPGVASGMVVVLALSVPGASNSVGALVVLAFVVAAAMAERVPWRPVQLALSAMAFAALVTGVGQLGSSFYRTPLLAAILAGLVLAGSAFLAAIRARRTHLRSAMVVTLILMVLAASFVLAPVRRGTGALVAAAAGLTGSPQLVALALALEPSQSRGRGNIFGTATDRYLFWRDIAVFNLEDPRRFFVGSGHARSFFEAVRPGEVFLDFRLLEPHNSFFAAFFRYGILGVLAFVALVIGVAQRTARSSGGSSLPWLFASLAIALAYANFEVALESPHGAVVFWSMLILPAGVERASRARRSIPGRGS